MATEKAQGRQDAKDAKETAKAISCANRGFACGSAGGACRTILPMSRVFPSDAECARHTIFPGVNIATCAGEQMMLSYVTLEPRSVVAEHRHPHEQVGMVVAGRALFVVGGEEKILGPGDRYVIPGNVAHRVTALDEPVVALDVFCPIREDYL